MFPYVGNVITQMDELFSEGQGSTTNQLILNGQMISNDEKPHAWGMEFFFDQTRLDFDETFALNEAFDPEWQYH